jgi:hypothetical protein
VAAEEQEAGSGEQRRTKNLGVLDLTGMRSREDAARLRLENVGLVLVPEDMPDLLARADGRNVGAVVPGPAGTRLEHRAGQLEVGGEALAAGDANTILSLSGQVVITPPLASVGYRGLVLVGQVFLPRSGEAALARKLLHAAGQVIPYDDDARPRVFVGGQRLTRGFFDLCQEPITLVLVGGGTFAADVTPEVLRRAVRSAVLIGGATVEDGALAPVLQYLARTQIGPIVVAGAEGA